MFDVRKTKHRTSSTEHRKFQFQHTFITQTASFVFPFGDIGDILGFGFGQNQFHTVALQNIIHLTSENISASWATIGYVFLFHLRRN